MANNLIPAWNANGVIPPISNVSPASKDRSPYSVSLSEFVLNFATSAKRQEILKGYLEYRGILHSAGLRKGFQWLNGSFLENVEVTESRDPNDLDVVTFYFLPIGLTQQQVFSQDPHIFPRNRTEHELIKKKFLVDPYLVSFGLPVTNLVQLSAYWYSIWSHRRDLTWKGYLQIDLDPAEDLVAAAQLIQSGVQGATP